MCSVRSTSKSSGVSRTGVPLPAREAAAQQQVDLLDEATQVPLKDFLALVTYVEDRGGKVVKASDNGQLTAVESGGVLCLAQPRDAAELAVAGLAVGDGDDLAR